MTALIGITVPQPAKARFTKFLEGDSTSLANFLTKMVAGSVRFITSPTARSCADFRARSEREIDGTCSSV